MKDQLLYLSAGTKTLLNNNNIFSWNDIKIANGDVFKIKGVGEKRKKEITEVKPIHGLKLNSKKSKRIAPEIGQRRKNARRV